ncbi:hypothetical protein POV27_02970 [Aureisphaera galaxeae]|uniref:uridine kinase family protein n=1 Tax=Aureisphaera galaxeae TaxID=1538023 RepID=UPI0023507625|nr:hypothetical protein [Aureisphaera galaxeae]MDC8002995.1 hypothetical protein [Aureisphaera galaxeae]
MIGDDIQYHSDYELAVSQLLPSIEQKLKEQERIVIAIGGESGCGKSSLAKVLSVQLEQLTGTEPYTLHSDDYFKLPPKDNHEARLKDFSRIGPEEVDLELLDTHSELFKNGVKNITKPLVDYEKNEILKKTITISLRNSLIIEGTYAILLKNTDIRVFMEATFRDSENRRIGRDRDPINEFNNRVLEKEHTIIKAHRELADFVISKSLQLTYKTKKYD